MNKTLRLSVPILLFFVPILVLGVSAPSVFADSTNYETLFGGIKTTLLGQGITTNIVTCASTPTACSNLYFEKTDKGRVTFTEPLDLTASSTITFLQDLGTKMDASAGSMKFDARTAYLLKSAGAQIKMYGLNALGFVDVPNIVVKNDAGIAIPSTDLTNYPALSDITYDATANDGTLTFNTSHFTTFETKKVINVTTGVGYDTIRDATDAAVFGGNVIRIAAGTYDQGAGVISIIGSITIQGPNAAISPNSTTRPRVAEAIITGNAGGSAATFDIKWGGAHVTFEGLTFNTSGVGIRSDYSGSTVTLRKNIFSGTMSDGMHFKDPVLTVDDNLFSNLYTPKANIMQVDGNYPTSSNTVSFTKNTWSNITSGTADTIGALSLNSVTGTISDNTFSHVDNYGILVANQSGNLSITNNTFDYINNPNAAPTGNQLTLGTGIRTYHDPAGTYAGPITITGNTFSNSYLGIGVRAGSDISGSAITLNSNSFINNTSAAVLNAGTGTLDASQNWWDSSVLATVASKVTGDVIFKPYYLSSGMTMLSNTKDILIIFSFAALSVTGIIDQSTHTISAIVPFGTDVTTLVPTITLFGGTVSPASGVARDFTGTQTYTVTSVDETATQDYSVTVTMAANSAKAITFFSFPSGMGVIHEDSGTITVNVPHGTDVTSLVATFNTTGATTTIDGITQVSATTANNFATAKTYRVTAADGTTKDYVVTVTVLAETQTAPSGTGTVTVGSVNRGGGGGGNNRAIVATAETPVTSATSTQSRVLGAVVYNFANDLTVGSHGADVTALQQFLIDSGYAIPAGATGYFGAQTKVAVIAFQKARGIAQTGYVGPVTRSELNKGSSSSGLTSSQVSSIIAVLQAFNVDEAIITNVRSILTK
ncbi:MAG: peptidoglycan-binding protein [Candidatus Kaiserbacteria bacterium]|nr:peptidoglycan-binding protein [Candidatus Kaiserbacteria bacterium]